MFIKIFLMSLAFFQSLQKAHFSWSPILGLFAFCQHPGTINSILCCLYTSQVVSASLAFLTLKNQTNKQTNPHPTHGFRTHKLFRYFSLPWEKFLKVLVIAGSENCYGPVFFTCKCAFCILKEAAALNFRHTISLHSDTA